MSRMVVTRIIKLTVLLAAAISLYCIFKFSNEPFIGEIEINPYLYHLSVPHVCIHIAEIAIWEPGNQAEAFYDHLESHTTLYLNDTATQFFVGEQFLILREFNYYGIPLGSIGGGFPVCIMTENLSDGHYQSSLEIISTYGFVHTAFWEFEIIDGKISTYRILSPVFTELTGWRRMLFLQTWD
jgi:hypothetical protein